MAVRDAAKFAGSRAVTFALYVLAVIGISSWDRDPDSWGLTAFHLCAAVNFLWWAVARTIRHWHEDLQHDEKTARSQHVHAGPGPFHPGCPICNPTHYRHHKEG